MQYCIFKIFHVTKNAEKIFRDVSEAYQVLSDPNKRQMYDSGVNPDDPGFGKFILEFNS